MSVDMGDVAARKKKRRTLNLIEALLGASDKLSGCNNLACKLRWQLFKEAKVLSRYNLDVALSNRADIQEREQVLSFIDDCG